MRKHIFGFALFSFVIVLTASIFAFFYTPPIRKVEKVKQEPVALTYSCPTKIKRERLSSRIQSIQFDLDRNVIVARIKLDWGGYGQKPKEVFTRILFFSENEEEQGFLANELRSNLNFSGKTSTFVLTFPIEKKFKINQKKNYYANISVQENSASWHNWNDYENDESYDKTLDNHPVLLMHGESSIIKSE